MMLRPSVLSLLLALPLAAAPALRDVAAWKQGVEALDTELWDIANDRFEQALQTPDLSVNDRRTIELKRIETWIRGTHPDLALAKLAEPAFATLPESYFWKAQAQAGLGQYREAVESLAPASENPKIVYRNEALLTRANLQVALGDFTAANDTLDLLARTADPKTARLARLRQAAVLIDDGKTAEARKILPAAKTVEESERPEQAFLNARLLLAEGKASEAASAFSILKDQPDGQSLMRYHATILGLADALAATGDTNAAVDLILAELQRQKDSPVLSEVFKRLLSWIPAQPAPDDTILKRLEQWCPPQLPVPRGPIAYSATTTRETDRTGAIDAWPMNETSPATAQSDELAAFALYTRALGVHRQGTPDSKEEAELLLTRLRLEHPRHFLAPKALLQLGRWKLEEGQIDSALIALDAVQQSTARPSLRGEAAFVEARSEFDRGNLEAAAAFFDQASKLLPDGAGDRAALNSALARLQNGSVPAVPRSGDAERDERIRADLELERALSEPSYQASLDELKQFLGAYPGHPRTAEARVAAATAALKMHPPALDFARAQVDTITADPALLKTLPADQLAFLRLEIADQENNPTEAVKLARAYMDAYPTGAKVADATMIRGRNLFRAGEYHTARLVMQRLADANPTSEIAPAALLLAARAAALGATDQSREESLALYDKVAKGGSALAPLARMERANQLTTLNRLDQAVTELQPWFQSMKPGDPLRIPAGMLLSQALYAQGSGNPGSLASALSIYDQLIVEAKSQPAILNRLYYLRGQTLERLPRADGSEGTRKGDALDSYVRVLQNAGEQPPAEWEYFERCGFSALQLLEEARKWSAAIKIANKIASFKGPRATEAAERAEGLRLEHMIWEE